MSSKPLKCCLCGGDIEEQFTPEGVMFWDQGNNPAPLSTVEGARCCGECNMTKVLPARLKGLFNPAIGNFVVEENQLIDRRQFPEA